MKPLIAESGYGFVKNQTFNSLNIYLDASPVSNLTWDSLESEIETALKLKAKLSLELDFGFSKKAYFKSQPTFASRSLALDEFEKRVLTPYREEISTILVYRGDGDFKDEIVNDASLYDDFLNWKKEFFLNKDITDQMVRTFSMEVLMYYLHRLVAPIIEEIPLVAFFDLSKISRPSYQAELLSTNFFSYIKPGVKGSQILFNGFGWECSGNLGALGHKPQKLNEIATTTLGLILPKIGEVPYDLFDQTITTLAKENISYQIIPEELMIDSWHGLDFILVFSDSISSEGIRMLQGFNAAEGVVVSVGKSLALSEEIGLEELIRSRGIRTPDLLVPNQTR